MSEARERYDRAQELYEHRIRLFFLVTQLPPDRLIRLRRVLDKLTPDDLDQLESFAIGLAAWREPAQESQDAPQGIPSANAKPG